MLLSLLSTVIALASADIKCPVKISLTGELRPGAATRIMVYEDPLNPFETFPSALPYDTTIMMSPSARCYGFWQGIAPTIKNIALRISSQSGSIIDIACEDGEKNCGSAEAYFKLSKNCRLQ